MTLIGVFCLIYTGVHASSIDIIREKEFHAIRRSCTKCIAEADECITRNQLTTWYALRSKERSELQTQLMSNLINSDKLIEAFILVDTHKLRMELDKPFFEHDNGYCWLLDAQLSFYNSMRILIRSYIKRVHAYFNKDKASCSVRPFRGFR